MFVIRPALTGTDRPQEVKNQGFSFNEVHKIRFSFFSSSIQSAFPSHSIVLAAVVVRPLNVVVYVTYLFIFLKKNTRKKKNSNYLSSPSLRRSHKTAAAPHNRYSGRAVPLVYSFHRTYLILYLFCIVEKGYAYEFAACTRCGRQVHSPRLFGEHFFSQPFFPRPVQIYYTHTHMRPNPFYLAHCAPCTYARTYTHTHIYTYIRFALCSPLCSRVQYYCTSASRFGRSSPDTHDEFFALLVVDFSRADRQPDDRRIHCLYTLCMCYGIYKTNIFKGVHYARLFYCRCQNIYCHDRTRVRYRFARFFFNGFVIGRFARLYWVGGGLT